MNNDYYYYLVNEIKLRPYDRNLSANVRQYIECLLCGNVFSAGVKGKVANYKKHKIPGCRQCTNVHRYSDSRTDNITIVEKKFEILHPKKEELIRLTKESRVKVRNRVCGHTFHARWDNLKNELSNCPKCNNIKKAERCRRLNEERHIISISTKNAWESYKSKVYKHTRVSYNKYKDIINPQNLERTRSGIEGYHLDHIASIKNCFEWGVPPEKCGNYRNLRMVEWKENSRKKNISLQDVPEIIYPYIDATSSDFVSSIKGISSITLNKYKDFGGRFSLTLYSKEKRKGIYYAEFYRCSEIPLQSKNYFQKMQKYFEKEGIETLIIFEDEWIFNQKLVQNKILHFLGESQKERVYARNCTIEKIDNVTKNTFLNINHIQGTAISQVNLGAYHGNELVAVMTFTEPRKQMGYDKSNISNNEVMELSRFAVLQEYRVIGIASKLLTKFFKLYPGVIKVFSFADLRWSSGKLYDALGFRKVKILPPNYTYIVDGKRKHRWGYRKSMIEKRLPEVYDEKLTEIAMMNKAGYDRIWNAGYIKYQIKNR